MKNIKSERGITLVALVITIIVMLILAGVSISLSVGNNGILTQSQKAVQENEKSKVEEEVKMAMAEAQIDYYAAHTQDSTVTKRAYYGKIDYYTKNCTSATENGIIITIGTTEGEDNNGNIGEIKIEYKTKTNNKYTFVFNLENPEEFTSVVGPVPVTE